MYNLVDVVKIIFITGCTFGHAIFLYLLNSIFPRNPNDSHPQSMLPNGIGFNTQHKYRKPVSYGQVLFPRLIRDQSREHVND
ncbi:unnamed protein product [Onchocerca flexuosa]|uniref:Uncharacterized protein n=1 Tax=Onchocerca flexuosa TaxID=387005 RepID=A0A183H1L4_9BILA|nr:unnamed protein product [Onchocerca flexuosa]